MAEQDATPLRYRARMVPTGARTGVGDRGESAAELAKRLYDAGAEFAEVWREDPFQVVGGVSWDPDPKRRRRIWWGER